MCHLRAVTLAVALASTAVGCASVGGHRDFSAARSPSGVSLVFDHFGKAGDPLDARIANTGPSGAAQLTGTDYWLRIRNESGGAISLTAFGMYFNVPFEWYSLPNGTLVPAVEENVDVSVVFERRRPSGRLEPYAGPIDSFGGALLPPGRSVIFSVPKAALPRRWAVCVPYTVFAQQGAREERVCYTGPP